MESKSKLLLLINEPDRAVYVNRDCIQYVSAIRKGEKTVVYVQFTTGGYIQHELEGDSASFVGRVVRSMAL